MPHAAGGDVASAAAALNALRDRVPSLRTSVCHDGPPSTADQKTLSSTDARDTTDRALTPPAIEAPERGGRPAAPPSPPNAQPAWPVCVDRLEYTSHHRTVSTTANDHGRSVLLSPAQQQV